MAARFDYFYVILAVSISSSLAVGKTWIQNNNWGSKTNWSPQRLPCTNDIVNINVEDISVFVNKNSTVKELILPQSGAVVFGDSVELVFSDGTPSKTCEGGEIHFKGSGSNDWFDPRNWQTSTKTHYPWQIPCQHDIVRFPKDSSYNVVINKNAVVSQLFIGQKELKQTDFENYITSNNGMQRITLAPSVKFQITGKKCADKSGCVCGNDKQRDYICKFVPSPKLQCTQNVKPAGACSHICGTVLLVDVSSEFNKASTEQKIKNMLKKFPKVTFTSVKIEDHRIQIVFEDESSGKGSKVAAHSIREALLADDALNILKIETLPKEHSAVTGKRTDDVKSGLVVGIPVFVIAIVAIVVIVAFLLRKSKARRQREFTLHYDENSPAGDTIDNKGGAIINPLYEDRTLEMENIGNTNASSASEGTPNPLYEVSLSPKDENPE